MTWFADLSPWTYLGFELPQVKAVGWLSNEHSYTKGDVSEEVYHRLAELLIDPWTPFDGCYMGFHGCELCRFTEGVTSSNEFVIPGDGCLYVIPENITHYMDAHEYQPPAEFLDAVMVWPDTRGMEYKKAFLANGGRELLQAIESQMNVIG